jgi:hypothetical protein
MDTACSVLTVWDFAENETEKYIVILKNATNILVALIYGIYF